MRFYPCLFRFCLLFSFACFPFRFGRVLCSPCFGISLFRVSFPFFLFLCAEWRSRRARSPWLARSFDIFLFVVASSAQLYCVRFALLLPLSAFFTIYYFRICSFKRIFIFLLTIVYFCAIFLLDNKQ